MSKPTKKPAKKIAKKAATKTGFPRSRAAQPQLPTKAIAPKDERPGLEKISKQTRVIGMLRSSDGASIASMMKLTGWQRHSVRGFLAGVVKKKLRLKLGSEAIDGVRLYRIIDEQTGSTVPSKRKRAR